MLDLYGASIARATGNPNIPQPGPEWERVHVFVPQWQRLKVKQSEEFEPDGQSQPGVHSFFFLSAISFSSLDNSSLLTSRVVNR